MNLEHRLKLRSIPRKEQLLILLKIKENRENPLKKESKGEKLKSRKALEPDGR